MGRLDLEGAGLLAELEVLHRLGGLRHRQDREHQEDEGADADEDPVVDEPERLDPRGRELGDQNEGAHNHAGGDEGVERELQDAEAAEDLTAAEVEEVQTELL